MGLCKCSNRDAFIDIWTSYSHYSVDISSVVIKRGSDLDSSRYEVSGPMIIKLAKKTFNFLVQAQVTLSLSFHVRAEYLKLDIESK